jgi:hypothetical protein
MEGVWANDDRKRIATLRTIDACCASLGRNARRYRRIGARVRAATTIEAFKRPAMYLRFGEISAFCLSYPLIDRPLWVGSASSMTSEAGIRSALNRQRQTARSSRRHVVDHWPFLVVLGNISDQLRGTPCD